MDYSASSNLRTFIVNVYVPRKDPDVVSNFARNSVRHSVGEWELRVDSDAGLTVQDSLYSLYRSY